MTEFINSLHSNYANVTKMTLFNYLRTGNPVFDAIISTIIISLFGYIINFIYENDRILFKMNFDDLKYFFYKKNTIIIEGKRSSTTSSYSLNHNISSLYSDRFKAIWSYVISNIEKNNSIYRIKETYSNFHSSTNDIDNKKKNLDIFMVFQDKHFTIDNNIFVKAVTEQEDSKDDNAKITTKTDKFTIYIYSYIHSLSFLKNYIDNITEKYLASIKENRSNKRFIYTLDKILHSEDESILDCWREDIFESYRNFNNIFFDGKKELLSKIDFFLNNSDWYIEKGIPYSLGIGLYGPPGTGKTSFIKALANHTKRHIIVISLKIIKTKRQLERFFFENTYNDKNEKSNMTFNKKIIVFEDIDCIGDIVLNRESKLNKKNPMRSKKINTNENNMNIGNVIQTICDLNETATCNVSLKNDDQAITLDDILNLWDGIRETPGRILIISSNHYDKLDSALIRPGRIDITHEFSNSSHNIISEIYLHLFGNKIDKKVLKNIKEYFYSPAELINIYVSHKNEKDFLERIVKNKKM